MPPMRSRPPLRFFGELLHPEDKPALDEVLRQYAEDGRESHNLECRLKTKGGDWRWIMTRGRIVRRDAAGKPVHMIGTHVDITERKRSEEALREANETLNSYLEHSPLAVIEWDSDCRVTRWSGEAERIFGWTAAEVLGRRFDEIPWVPGEDLACVAAVANELRTGCERQLHFKKPERSKRRHGDPLRMGQHGDCRCGRADGCSVAGSGRERARAAERGIGAPATLGGIQPRHHLPY